VVLRCLHLRPLHSRYAQTAELPARAAKANPQPAGTRRVKRAVRPRLSPVPSVRSASRAPSAAGAAAAGDFAGRL